jgi:Rrf2 family protein
VIAEKQTIPSRYLEEIISDLRKSGFVIGKRGPQGGYRLARPAEEILVSDVLAALVTTTARAGRTHDEIARLVERSVDQRFERAIAGLTLSDLLLEARSAHRSQAANYVI